MIDLEKRSIEIIEKYQNKSGAFTACPNFATYNYCWLRDGSFIANSMDIEGRFETADRYFNWANRVIISEEDKVVKLLEKKKNGQIIINTDFLPTRFTLDGKETGDDWPNFQLDGYGTYLWALSEHIRLTDNANLIDKYNKSIKLTIAYLINFWGTPNFDCWEENGDKIHPATLSTIYGGLKNISYYYNEEHIHAVLCHIKEYILNKCITNNRLSKFQGSNSIDASLLWAIYPFEVFDIKDEIVINTVKDIESKLLSRNGVQRYPEDTYYGGGQWPLLSSFLGLVYIKMGKKDKAKDILKWVEAIANDNGEIPEQVINKVNDAKYIKTWEDRWGKAASPLLWSHAMYIILKKLYNS